MVHARDFCSRKGAKDANDSYGMQDLAVLAAWREMVHSVFLFSQRRKGRKGFLWNAGLGGLSGLVRDGSRKRFLFSQRRGGRKGFLRNAGLSGLGGLARDINDSRVRIFILAKARRTQRIPMECRTWRS